MIKPSRVVFISDELENSFNSLPENDFVKKSIIRSLMVLPLNSAWIKIKGIPQRRCLEILDAFAYCLVEEYEHEDHDDYQAMVKDIRQKKIVPFGIKRAA